MQSNNLNLPKDAFKKEFDVKVNNKDKNIKINNNYLNIRLIALLKL